MKLIDLLVQELPKMGGWPESSREVCAVQDKDQEVKFVFSDSYLRFENKSCGTWGSDTSNSWLDHNRVHREARNFDANILCSDYSFSKVSREQYEAALAASQQPAWNGEGLPPVGCECEFYNDDYDVLPSCPKDGQIVKIVAHQKSKNGLDLAVFTWTGERNGLHAEVCTEMLFRPIRTEAERKRDEFINQLMKEWLFLGHDREQAGSLYDAIAAGKIPGVKLE